MARPTKKGLDYYPLDVGFLDNIKIRRIMRACGSKSISILICLLGNIYGGHGYYLVWDSEMPALIADKIGISGVNGIGGVSARAVIETVNTAVQLDFFSANMLNNYGILTSKSIQERYFEATSRRKAVCYDARFMLLNINVYKNLVNVDDNSVNVNINTQSKVKESKGKESRVKNAMHTKTSFAPHVSLTEDEYRELADELGEGVVRECISILDSYKDSSGKEYDSDYDAIRRWVIDAYLERHRDKDKNDVQAAALEVIRRRKERKNGQ